MRPVLTEVNKSGGLLYMVLAHDEPYVVSSKMELALGILCPERMKAETRGQSPVLYSLTAGINACGTRGHNNKRRSPSGLRLFTARRCCLSLLLLHLQVVFHREHSRDA